MCVCACQCVSIDSPSLCEKGIDFSPSVNVDEGVLQEFLEDGVTCLINPPACIFVTMYV